VYSNSPAALATLTKSLAEARIRMDYISCQPQGNSAPRGARPRSGSSVNTGHSTTADPLNSVQSGGLARHRFIHTIPSDVRQRIAWSRSCPGTRVFGVKQQVSRLCAAPRAIAGKVHRNYNRSPARLALYADWVSERQSWGTAAQDAVIQKTR